MWSSFKRNGKQKGLTLEEWHEKIFPLTCSYTLSCAKGWKQAIENGLEENILLIRYEQLCTDQVEISQQMFEFLGLEFEKHYLCFEKPRYRHVYGEQVSTDYLTEYKEHMPKAICQDIIEKTAEFKDWLWNE
jgi:hypothetical protein